MSSYSKAPWGLSVLSQVPGIFTGITISPSLLLRQCPNRYAFRAGRNLPDKEFRYLRTVIVTAAVYWGLRSLLRLLLQIPLTFQHRAGVSSYTSPCGFAETYVFAKQSLGPFLCDHISMVPLLPKLRGYFAEFLNNSSLVDLRILSSPTCVGLRYGHLRLPSGFSRQSDFWGFATFISLPVTAHDCLCLLSHMLTCRLDTLDQRRAPRFLLRPRFGHATTVVRDLLPVVHQLRFSALS